MSAVRRPFRFASSNVNSMRSNVKRNLIHATIISNDLDSILIQGSKLEQQIFDDCCFLPGYKSFRLDRKLKGGGVFCYVKDCLRPRVLHTVPGLEALCISCSIVNFIVNVYCPPSTVREHFSSFLDKLSTLLGNCGDAKVFGNLTGIVSTAPSVDDEAIAFKIFIHDVLTQVVPVKNVRISSQGKPEWFSRVVNQAIRDRNKVWLKSDKTYAVTHDDKAEVLANQYNKVWAECDPEIQYEPLSIYHALPFFIDVSDCFDLLKAIDHKQSAGSDGIPPTVHKDCATALRHFIRASSCQDLITRIASKAAELGLKIKPAKTKAMYFHLETPPSLSVYDDPIEVVPSFTYLGSVISGERVAASDDIATRIHKASQCFGRLRKWIFDRNDLSISLKMKVYNTSVITILLYASETWAFTMTDLNALEVFHHYTLRTILKMTRLQQIPNIRIRELCNNQPSISQFIRTRRMRWAGHVARMPRNRLCGSIWRNPKPPNWRCVRSAARCTWDSLLEKDLAYLKPTYGAANWANNYTSIITDLAADRLQWRAITGGQAMADAGRL